MGADAGGEGGRCGAPGRRAAQRAATVGGPPWQIPTGILVAASLAQPVAAIALLATAGDLARGAFYGPTQLAAVHLFGLAFLSVAVIGALLQLAPVVLRQQVAGPQAAILVGAFFAGGSWAMAAGFLLQRDVAIATGATLLVIAGAAFVALLSRALVRAARGGTFGAAGAGLTAAAVWFAVVLAMGAVMAGNLIHPFLAIDRLDMIAAHAAAATLGWIGGTILAVSLKLAPMFALGHGRRAWLGSAALAIWHPACVALVAGLLAGNARLAAIGTVLVAVAALVAGAFAADVARARRRRLEAPFVHLALGLAAVVAACALALRAWWFDGDPIRAGIAATVLVLVGLGAGVTSGHLFKVVPMLVWVGRYSTRAGTPGVPRLADLYPARLAAVEQGAFTAGLLLLVGGVLAASPAAATAGAALLGVSAAAIAAAVLFTVLGRGRPSPDPAKGAGPAVPIHASHIRKAGTA